MPHRTKTVTILVADDDPDDRTLTREAFEAAHVANDLRFVEDGEELLDYLQRRGKYSNAESAPWPSIILLDLNMPRMDGREALRAIRADARLRGIRVVVMTTSKAEEDILRSYDLSAASYITKPVTFDALVEVVRSLGRYWLEIVELAPRKPTPPDPRREAAVRDLADMTAEPLSVLLIDDDREDYLLTREMLADVGGVVFRLDHAATYEDGLTLLREGRHDAVLLDYRLGGRTGIELLREAQELERRPPIILLTGKGQREIAFEALTLGVSDYLEKAGLSPALLERVILYAMRQRRQEAQLADKVRERTAELARANDALRDEDRRKNDFIAMLAHELRNPLAPIRNALEIMRLTVDDSDAIERTRAMLERQVGQMVRLIDDLLDVSRITTGKLRVQPEAITLGAVLEAAVEISRPALDKAKVRFDTAVPAEPIPLRGDRVRLAQVFSNLLNNAAKYTPEGGSVVLTVGREGAEAVVTVRDSGVGIPADVLPRVFDLFTQVDRTLNRSQGGLGIGLALVQRLVQLHDGRVTVRSDGPGQGAEFTVRLPVSEA